MSDERATYRVYLLPGIAFLPNGPGGEWSGTNEWESVGDYADADLAERRAQRESLEGFVRVYEVRGGRTEYLSEWMAGDALAAEGYDGADPGPLVASPPEAGPCVVVRPPAPRAVLPETMDALVDGIDWPLLREQKLWLLAQAGDEADGLVGFLDGFMDAAAGIVGERTVFGPLDDE